MHLAGRNRLLSRANEAVMPFYILHQTVLLSVGFFVVRWGLPAGAKYGVIAISSLVACVLLYEYVVRRFAVLRFLCGMNPAKRPTVAFNPSDAASALPSPPAGLPTRRPR